MIIQAVNHYLNTETLSNKGKVLAYLLLQKYQRISLMPEPSEDEIKDALNDVYTIEANYSHLFF